MILARATFRNILISSQKRGLGLASPSPVDRVEPRELRRAWTRLCLFGQADPSDGLANWQPVYLLHQSGAIAGLVRPAWRATRGRIRWHAIIALVRGDILHLDPPACYYYPSPPIGIRPRLLSNRELPPDPHAGRRIFAAVLIRALQDVFVPDQTATLEDRLDALTFLADYQVQQNVLDIYGHDLATIFKESPMPDRLRANTMYAEAHS